MTLIEVECWQVGMYIVGMGLDNEFSLLMQLYNRRIHRVRVLRATHVYILCLCNIFQLYSMCRESVQERYENVKKKKNTPTANRAFTAFKFIIHTYA